ncbi:MAG: BatA domain-containing protein [Candidatus Rariloculaceae bacterium]
MTLLAPAFLFGLLAIGVPLWLHRLSSENPNRQPFSSVMFLEPGEPRRVLAKKLQYLLLLALRIGILMLVAFAFARPALQGAAQTILGETASLQVIVMDVSASLGYGDRWDRAQDAADDIINDLEASDLGQLVAAGRLTRVMDDPSLDRVGLRQALNTLEPELFRIDYGQLVSGLDGIVRGVEIPVVVHLVTDLQRSSLPARFADLSPQVPLELRIHDISAPGETNTSVDGLAWTAASTEVAVGIRGYGTTESQATVVLELNGAEVARQQTTVPADAATQLSFDGLELEVGANRVRVFLTPNDELAVDDERSLVVRQPVPRPLLLVAGDPRGRDVLFISAAIDTLPELAFEIEQIAPGALADTTLADYPIVVVGDGGALAEQDSEQLREYVESGGALLMALGPRAAGLDEVPVTEHDFQAVSQFAGADTEYAAVGSLDRTHPALSNVDELRSARFSRYHGVEPAPGDGVLVALDDGTPLLIEHNFGDGRALVFTSSLDREWNDLPVQPVFVPFLAELSTYLTGGLALSSESSLGSTLSPRVAGLAGGQIFDPQGDKALGLAGAGSGDDVLLDQTGFYEIVGAGRMELVAVNVDPRESDLAVMEPNAVARWQTFGPGASENAQNGGANLAEVPPTPLWTWLLGLLAVIVVVESWVGNWHLRVRRGIAA